MYGNIYKNMENGLAFCVLDFVAKLSSECGLKISKHGVQIDATIKMSGSARRRRLLQDPQKVSMSDTFLEPCGGLG